MTRRGWGSSWPCTRYPNAQDAPKTPAARDQYCEYVRDALARLPSIRDVVIWNEPNKSQFWSPQSAEAPVAYEALLARCYDVLHAAFADVNVIGFALSSTGNDDGGSHSPGAFIRAVGEAYRASGREQPLFDTVGHHVYGFTASERPWRQAHRLEGPLAGRLEQAHVQPLARLRRHGAGDPG